MARKSLGYIELVWICDSCQTKNPGAIKSYTSCGAPQPINVRFEKVDPETFNLVKDEALLRMAKSGPDKHCPFCGTRNLASATTCVECGGDLTVGATSRPTGEVVELAGQTPAITPPPTTSARPKISKGMLILIVVLVLGLCALMFVVLSQLFKTSALNATVSSVKWERAIVVEAWQQVEGSGWMSDLPGDADIIDCQSQFRYNSDTYKPNSTEVCGTPYTVDTGTGFGEVVQDCYYQVYEDYCRYNMMAWTTVDTLSLSGYDLNPAWPTANLSNTQRFGDQTARYTIWFDADGQTYSLTTSDLALFQQAYPGSDWTIEVNNFGSVSSAEPAN